MSDSSANFPIVSRLFSFDRTVKFKVLSKVDKNFVGPRGWTIPRLPLLVFLRSFGYDIRNMLVSVLDMIYIWIKNQNHEKYLA